MASCRGFARCDVVVGLLLASCSMVRAAMSGPMPHFAPWLGSAVWERLHFKMPAQDGQLNTDELVRYVQCPAKADSSHGAPFLDLRVSRGALPPASTLPASLESYSMEELVWMFSSATAFAGLACANEQATSSLDRRFGQKEEVICWHAPLRTWPPEDVAASWLAADQRQLQTEDCGRVHHLSQSALTQDKVDEWFEYDLSGEAFEERWHRLQPVVQDSVDHLGSIALGRLHEAPFELLVVTAGRFGYFRDSRSPALVAELINLDRRGIGLDKILLDNSWSVESRRAAVDCEASVGIVHGWLIEQAVLPWKVGQQLQVLRSDGWVDLTASDEPSEALLAQVGALFGRARTDELSNEV